MRSAAALERRVAWVHRHCGHDAIAERYVDGREVTVGLLGNRRPHCLPLWETYFDGVADGAPRIVTERIKWNLDHRRARAVHSGPARRLPRGAAQEIARLALRAWRVLRLSGFARIDFRIDADGRPWLIDVNANPDVDFHEDFARAAAHEGIRPTRCCSACSTWACAIARTGSANVAPSFSDWQEKAMSSDVVLIDDPAPQVRRITLNRPEKRNALNHALRGGIIRALQAADADPARARDDRARRGQVLLGRLRPRRRQRGPGASLVYAGR